MVVEVVSRVSNRINEVLMRLGLILTRRANVIPSERLSQSRQNLFRILDFEVVVDVGANSGQWASSIRLDGYTGLIVSLEPIPRVFTELALNAVADEKWIAINGAIDSARGLRDLYISSNHGLSSSFFPLLDDHKIAVPEVNFIGVEQVETYPLEELLLMYQSQRFFIKIDTQGSELIALQSMSTESFKKILAVEVEVSLVGTYESCPLIEEIISYMRTRNFRPYRIENGLARPNFGQQVQVDILFIREDLSHAVP